MKTGRRIFIAWIFTAAIVCAEESTPADGGKRNPEELAKAEVAAGSKFVEEQKYLSAADAFERATQAAPAFYDAWVNWGVALWKLGGQAINSEIKLVRFQAATTKFEQAAQLQPDRAWAYKAWVEALVSAGDLPLDATTRLACYSGAAEKSRRALELDPKDWMTANRWGEILIDRLAPFSRDNDALLKVYEEAVGHFATAYDNARFSGEKGPICANWGKALMGMARTVHAVELRIELLEKSLDQFARASKFVPREPSTHAVWGLALTELGRIKESRTYYRLAVDKFAQSVELNPDQPQVLYDMARAYTLNNDAFLAIETLGKCFEADESGRYLELTPQESDFRALLTNPDYASLIRNARAKR